MSIQEKVLTDLTSAIKNKDEVKKSILRVAIGEFNRVDKIVSDEKATSILKKMVENLKMAPTANGAIEMDIISGYLPKQMSKEEIEVVIAGLITSTGATSVKEMGKIMGGLKQYAGQYDGKLASEIIKSKLS